MQPFSIWVHPPLQTEFWWLQGWAEEYPSHWPLILGIVWPLILGIVWMTNSPMPWNLHWSRRRLRIKDCGRKPTPWEKHCGVLTVAVGGTEGSRDPNKCVNLEANASSGPFAGRRTQGPQCVHSHIGCRKVLRKCLFHGAAKVPINYIV